MKIVAKELDTKSVMGIIRVKKVVFEAVLLHKIDKYREMVRLERGTIAI